MYFDAGFCSIGASSTAKTIVPNRAGKMKIESSPQLGSLTSKRSERTEPNEETRSLVTGAAAELKNEAEETTKTLLSYFGLRSSPILFFKTRLGDWVEATYTRTGKTIRLFVLPSLLLVVNAREYLKRRILSLVYTCAKCERARYRK